MSSGEFPLVNRYQAAWNEQAVRTGQRITLLQLYLVACGVLLGFWINHAPEVSPELKAPIPQKSEPPARAFQQFDPQNSLQASHPQVPQDFPRESNVTQDGPQIIRTQEQEIRRQFVAWGVSLLTLVSSMLMWHVNSVIRSLTEFMRNCEVAMRQTIHNQAGQPKGEKVNLFRFFDGNSETAGVLAEVPPFHMCHRFANRILFAGILLATNTAAITITWDPGHRSLAWWCCVPLTLSMIILLFDEIRDLTMFLSAFNRWLQQPKRNSGGPDFWPTLRQTRRLLRLKAASFFSKT
jgi:hypothetical protein